MELLKKFQKLDLVQNRERLIVSYQPLRELISGAHSLHLITKFTICKKTKWRTYAF